MPKTSEEIVEELIDKDNFEDGEGIIYTYKYSEEFLQTKWYSEQELQDKLKLAEKRIDETKHSHGHRYIFHTGSYNQGLERAKQILCDCFGDGK